MSRPLRIELAGGVYHVTSRGDRREDIFLNDDDRVAWLGIVGAVCARFNWACHAWCQMTNHYHLVIETPEANLSQGMRQLNGVYTQHVNRAHARVGHVFQGRYKAILVEKQAYLNELARYVVLNPVRAGMVESPEQWAWSSFRAMAGHGNRPPWLTIDWILGQFGSRRDEAVGAYVDFVRAGAGLPSVWDGLRNQIYLGGERFVDQLQAQTAMEADLSEIPRIQRRPVAKPLAAYAAEVADRALAMASAFRSGDYSMREIADHFGVHYSTVSRCVLRHSADRYDE